MPLYYDKKRWEWLSFITWTEPWEAISSSTKDTVNKELGEL